ncbi:MAG: hypothetical protein JRN15_10010 [Nitrososphaerota archaeon]|nr:hypothetical protein [Nitrososphaerota archaeon]
MPVNLKGNFIFVQRGQPAYEVSSNYTNYIEIGNRDTTKYHLIATIEKDGFKISGRFLDSFGKELFVMRDNFIEPSSHCQKEMTKSGYRIKDEHGNLVFAIVVSVDNICHLKGTIYGESGEVVAAERNDSFVIAKGPAVLGKSGNALGLVFK